MELTVHYGTAVLQIEVFQVKYSSRAMRKAANPYLKGLTNDYPELAVSLPEFSL